MHSADSLDRVAWLFGVERGVRKLRETLGAAEAHVQAVIEEARDVKTYVLDPGPGFTGHRAGQHLPVEVEIDGVRTTRCYSISAAPGEPVSITVKRVPGGRVSSHLHARLRPGVRLRVGAARGDFVLDAPRGPLLLASGGSGATPVYAILRDLARRGRLGDVVWLHAAKTAEDLLFAPKVRAIATAHSGLRVLLHVDAHDGLLDPARLRAMVPDLDQRETFLCGPTGFMALVEGTSRAPRIHRELFGFAPSRRGEAGVEVRLARSGRTLLLRGGGTLLEELERAGERPPHGCRIGICNSCRCEKRAGVVEDLARGARIEEPGPIRICTSIARSDLELDL
jgi:ferredoxin-NADP reductase